MLFRKLLTRSPLQVYKCGNVEGMGRGGGGRLIGHKESGGHCPTITGGEGDGHHRSIRGGVVLHHKLKVARRKDPWFKKRVRGERRQREMEGERERKRRREICRG